MRRSGHSHAIETLCENSLMLIKADIFAQQVFTEADLQPMSQKFNAQQPDISPAIYITL